MKQRVLNAAILTALGLGAAGMAQGQQVLDSNEVAEDAPTYARQIPNDSTLTLPAGDDVIQFELGFGISNGDERFIRLDVINGDFGTAPTVSAFSCSTVGGGTTACGFAIGATGTDFIVVGISATTTNLAPTQRVDVDLGSIDVDVTDEDDPVELQFRLYEDPVEANQPGGGDGTLNDITDEIALFADGLFTDSANTGTCTIDVTDNSMTLLDDGFPATSGRGGGAIDTCVCGNEIELGPVSGVLWTDGDDVGASDILATSGNTLVVETDTTFGYADGATSGVYTSGATSGSFACSTSLDSGAISMDQQSATISPSGPLANNSFGEVAICLENTTSGEFTSAEVTASINLVAANSNIILDDPVRELADPLCDFDKNGSEDNLIFNLTQGGFYTQFVRITNPTSQDGLVFLTCYDDFGNAARIGLDDLVDRDDPLDPLPPELGAQQSTDLINIDDVWDACADADGSLIVPGAGGPGSPNGQFLRLKAEGEFGRTEATTGQGEVLGIRIEGLTVSIDGNSFENISR